jgi:Uncharacterized protein conserved in bacteria
MHIDFLPSIHAVGADQWNALCTTDYPFVRHEFLAALEDSASTTLSTGWQPHHLVVRDQDDLLAAMPLFIKHHSYGEYVFDWAWANAWQSYGFAYYPKLVSAIPFTPCYGPRLLVNQHRQSGELLAQLVPQVQQHILHQGFSGWHCLFPDVALKEQLSELAMKPRLGCQFHWFNRGYKNFSDFLEQMTSRKRKNIQKERRRVEEQGFAFEWKRGSEITADDWDFFAGLYRLTYLKRSGHSGYLQREFFHLLGQHLLDNTLLIIARHEGTAVAAALFLHDSTTLYGRYWGCREEFDFLHFETCYYQGIDFAIAEGLQRFDGGAQGEHKIQRGFEPVATWSNHWVAAEEFRPAIDHFLAEETRSVMEYMSAAREHLPFKHEC